MCLREQEVDITADMQQLCGNSSREMFLKLLDGRNCFLNCEGDIVMPHLGAVG